MLSYAKQLLAVAVHLKRHHVTEKEFGVLYPAAHLVSKTTPDFTQKERWNFNELKAK